MGKAAGLLVSGGLDAIKTKEHYMSYAVLFSRISSEVIHENSRVKC